MEFTSTGSPFPGTWRLKRTQKSIFGSDGAIGGVFSVDEGSGDRRGNHSDCELLVTGTISSIVKIVGVSTVSPGLLEVRTVAGTRVPVSWHPGEV
jgi:hypothetical protein